MRRIIVVAVLAGTILALCQTISANSAAAAHSQWLCHPSLSHDVCDVGQDSTDLRTGLRTNPARIRESSKPVDCFYVYPTASLDPVVNAPLQSSLDIDTVTRMQAARFAPKCRMFAPLYRQVTLPGVYPVMYGWRYPTDIAYASVLAAWRNYLATSNHGRGVVFIGHSQGTLMLRRLIREQIDPNPVLRKRMVGAVLLGGNVMTGRGHTRGGDFRNIPVCTVRGQAGCVVAYSTNTNVPLISGFGNSYLDAFSWAWGLTQGGMFQVACTDPAALSGDRTPFGVVVPSNIPTSGMIGGATRLAFVPDGPPTSSSTWTISRGRAIGRCVEANGINQYHVQFITPQSILETPGNQTHMLDFQFGLDRLVSIVAQQTRTWKSSR